MKKLFLLYIIFIPAIIWGQTIDGDTYLNKIENEKQFKNFEGKPLSDKYGGATALKVVVDRTSGKIYFIDSKLYQYHYDFCTAILGETENLYDFNAINYQNDIRRKYILATINHYSSDNLYALEFAATEIFSKDVQWIYDLCKSNTFIGTKLMLFPRTNKQIEDIKIIAPTIPCVTADAIYKGLVYQPLVKNESYGYLRKIHLDSLKDKNIKSTDIILTNGSPNEMPLTRGVIVTEFQSPLSHITILCQNRNTPMMAYKLGFEDAHLQKLVGLPVHLIITQDTFYITLSTEELVKKYSSKIKNSKPLQLKIDTLISELISCEKLSYKSTYFAGGKAANFGELTKIRIDGEKLNMPCGAFVIPIHYYWNHITKNGFDTLIRNIYKDSLLQTNSTQLRAKLKSLRKQIEQAPFDSVLLSMIQNKLIATQCSTNRFRFRSSTNAEDIVGFGGAGLYESHTGILYDSVKSIARAIKKVWASTWTERAYLERGYFNINQTKVGMAILVNEAFGTEDINGVAITKNLYRETFHGIVVNMQKGETPVVSPPPNVTSEQEIIIDATEYHKKNTVVDYITFSNLNDGKPLLTKQQTEVLYKTLIAIKKHYYNNVLKLNDFLEYNKRLKSYVGAYESFAMDIEFKWLNGKLYVKQARVYND